jgi:hypothetical protein
MRRLLALAAFAAALVPASPASACDAGQNPLCLVDVCRNVNYWHRAVTTILTDPVPKPVC